MLGGHFKAARIGGRGKRELVREPLGQLDLRVFERMLLIGGLAWGILVYALIIVPWTAWDARKPNEPNADG